ncbi:quinolinate synthase NadA [Corynebacterium falsenii]|uniref:quinolinate synthase NadA n=1 Tax=Corynebacterium falsenii TaxID=108486 RepID=UPI001CC9EDF4|nr:quinolinate synthase NadA [Corynebacterium falsenii]UBI06846.1 quinolinate synthase NadA [Corynebacterium falsenii]
MTLLNDIRRGPHSWEGVNASPEWADRIRELKEEKNAIILAHNYQIPEIQDIADHTGDSLALSRIAADAEEDIIVFCGVHFMAETAKILSPDKKVLIPDAEAGCSLADSITADELRAWKAEYPDALVVSYVNTTAEVKALTDVCCTSSNAVDVVRHLPEDKDILFLPDQFLGAHVQRETGRDNIHVWAGECHVHAGINGKQLGDQAQEHPTSHLYIHPECGCANSAIYLAGEGAIDPDRVHMLSTGQMLGEATSLGEQNAGFAGSSSPSRTVLVATEIGMLHQLRKAAPGVDFLPVNEHASCPYMKMITPAALLRCLELEQDEVTVPADIADRARASVEAMISIGNPGGGE